MKTVEQFRVDFRSGAGGVLWNPNAASFLKRSPAAAQLPFDELPSFYHCAKHPGRSDCPGVWHNGKTLYNSQNKPKRGQQELHNRLPVTRVVGVPSGFSCLPLSFLPRRKNFNLVSFLEDPTFDFTSKASVVVEFFSFGTDDMLHL